MRGIVVVLLLLQLVATSAQAQVVADTMSCQQAVAYYERNGRIYKNVRGTAALPIYNGVPVSRRGDLRCPTKGISVRTLDNPRCIIAYTCLPRSR